MCEYLPFISANRTWRKSVWVLYTAKQYKQGSLQFLLKKTRQSKAIEGNEAMQKDWQSMKELPLQKVCPSLQH